MHSLLFLAFAVSSIASIVPRSIPTFEELPGGLPQGLFSGVNNGDGSTTLTFTETGEVVTFIPTPLPVGTRQVQKRDLCDCWTFQPKLNKAGVDQGITKYKQMLGAQGLIFLGYPPDSIVPKYYGYNNNGVYVYLCFNSHLHASSAAGLDQLNYLIKHMDDCCGQYNPGYAEYSSDYILFGKTLSGTSVCLG
jgi:hypothetical protein